MDVSDRRIPKGLIAFAFVEEEFARSGDIVRGLWPLFAPLLAKSAFRRFDPEAFAKAFEAAYDIPMSSLVAEGLVPQLAAAGLLIADSADPHVYRVADSEYLYPKARPHANESATLESVLDDFVAFSRASLERAGIVISGENLKEGLLRRLTDLNFLSFLERPDKNYFKGQKLTLAQPGEREERPADAQQALDVLCADFAIHTSETDATKFELLTRLSKGALVAEVVLTLQTPSADADLSAVTVILDGPLILDLLDLNTPELKEYSESLFQLVDRAKLKKATLVHTLEEMEGAVRAPLDADRKRHV